MLSFLPEDLDRIQAARKKYPTAQAAVMEVLWIAQERFRELNDEVIELVARTLSIPEAHVLGVAEFYTMYLRKNLASHLVEICTCFTCGECGGRELWEYATHKLQASSEGVSQDGFVWLRQAECLGACDTPPAVLVNNRRLIFHVTPEKFDALIDTLQKGQMPPFESVPIRNE